MREIMRALHHIIGLIAALLFAAFAAAAMPLAPAGSNQAEFSPFHQALASEHTDAHFTARAPPIAAANLAITGDVAAMHGGAFAAQGHETLVASLDFGVGFEAPNSGYLGPKVDPVPPKQADFPPGSTAGAARAWTKTARIKDAQLPNSGRIRFVPDPKWDGSTPIKRGPNNGYLDRFGNEWTKGPSRTQGQAFEWDVQLSNTGRQQIGWTTRDGSHANVSLDGRITHK